MSQPITIYWPSFNANLDSISASQTYEANAQINIQSNLPFMPNVSVNNSGVFEYNGMIRSVSFTTNDTLLAGNTVTVYGLGTVPDSGDLYKLAPLSEIVSAPLDLPLAAGTVETPELFKRIDRIIISGDLGDTSVSVGFGKLGITDYIFPNYNSSSPMNYALQGYPVDANNSFAYQFYCSLTKPEEVNSYFGNLNKFPEIIPAFEMMDVQHNLPYIISSATASQGQTSTAVGAIVPASIVWATIDDSNGDGDASFYFTFLQQGLKS